MIPTNSSERKLLLATAVETALTIAITDRMLVAEDGMDESDHGSLKTWTKAITDRFCLKGMGESDR